MKIPVIETKNLNFHYPDGSHALKNINIKIKKGEKVAFIGSNRAGKSTLFLNFNGILKPSSGSAIIYGIKLKDNKDILKNIRQKVGLVFQNHDDQLFAPTVVEDVAFGPMNMGLQEEEVEKKG